jgi:hypothetical protein
MDWYYSQKIGISQIIMNSQQCVVSLHINCKIWHDAIGQCSFVKTFLTNDIILLYQDTIVSEISNYSQICFMWPSKGTLK